MDDNQYPKIVSFVVRFVQEQARAGEQADYRGVIRHVQTDQELAFSDWDDAELFMEKFIPLKNTKRKD